MNSAQAGISLFLLLFTYVCGQITEIQRDTRIFAFNVNSNLSYVGHEFRNHQISNFSTKFLATQCAMECHRTPRCQSFNFASKTRQCQLNDATHDDFPDDLANDSSTAGVMYYLKDAITISSVSWKFHVWISNNFLLVLGKQSITVAMQHVYMICSRDYLFLFVFSLSLRNKIRDLEIRIDWDMSVFIFFSKYCTIRGWDYKLSSEIKWFNVSYCNTTLDSTVHQY